VHVSDGGVRCTGVALCDSQGRSCRVFEQGQTASFFYEFEALADLEVPTGGVELVSEKGIIVHGKSTIEHGTEVPPRVRRGSRLRFRQDIALEIAVGEYTFNVGVGTLSQADHDRCARYTHAELDARLVRRCLLPTVGTFAVLFRSVRAPAQLLHHGVANLPGTCRVSLVGPAEGARDAS
jgi:hypothetical protein